jgi:hypothetical protein
MKNILLAVLLSGALGVTSFAQVNQRFADQQDRIAAGIRNGRLSANEAGNLEYRERNIHREVRWDRSHDNGHLTSADRLRVANQQNRLSRSIYRDRHN